MHRKWLLSDVLSIYASEVKKWNWCLFCFGFFWAATLNLTTWQFYNQTGKNIDQADVDISCYLYLLQVICWIESKDLVYFNTMKWKVGLCLFTGVLKWALSNSTEFSWLYRWWNGPVQSMAYLSGSVDGKGIFLQSLLPLNGVGDFFFLSWLNLTGEWGMEGDSFWTHLFHLGLSLYFFHIILNYFE